MKNIKYAQRTCYKNCGTIIIMKFNIALVITTRKDYKNNYS